MFELGIVWHASLGIGFLAWWRAWRGRGNPFVPWLLAAAGLNFGAAAALGWLAWRLAAVNH